MSKTVIGLVGCGHWGKHILDDLLSLDCTVYTVARSDESRARAKASASIVRLTKELPECDGYVVATPTKTHCDTIMELLPRDKPIFVEKPLTADISSLYVLCDAYIPKRARVFVMDKWRYHPGVEALAGLAREGALGSILGVSTIRVGWGNGHSDVDPVWHLVPHDMAIFLEILGRIPSHRRNAILGPKRRSLIATLHSAAGPWAHLHMSTVTPETKRAITVVGETACATLGGSYAESIFLCSADPSKPPQSRTIPIPTVMPLWRELNAFVQYVRRAGPEPKSSFSDAVTIVNEISALLVDASA